MVPRKTASYRRMSLVPVTSHSEAIKIFQTINESAVEQILNLDEMTVSHLRVIETVDFNIFKIKEYTRDNEMVVIISHLLAKEKIFDNLPIQNEKFLEFIKKVQSSYLDILYHNKTHATDLAQSFVYICNQCELKKKCQLDSWDMMCYILAGACHDLGHPGVNNLFLTEKRDEIAITYNDISVLENFHVA
jgi:hypothetical protein